MTHMITDTTDIDTLAERIVSDIINGNISAACFALWGTNVAKDDIAILTLQVVYGLSVEMGGDFQKAYGKVRRIVNG